MRTSLVGILLAVFGTGVASTVLGQAPQWGPLEILDASARPCDDPLSPPFAGVPVTPGPRVDGGSDGTAHVVWGSSDRATGDGCEIRWRQHLPGSGWQPLETVQRTVTVDGVASLALRPDIAASADAGTATVVWTQWEPSSRRARPRTLKGSMFLAGEGWSEPEFLFTASTEGRRFHGLEMFGRNEAMVQWVLSNDGLDFDVVASVFRRESGFGPHEVLAENAVCSSCEPSLSGNRLGGMLGAWRTLNRFVDVRVFDDASGWGPPEGVAMIPFDASASDPVVAMDSRGNAFAAWVQGEDFVLTFPNTPTAIWANRYDRDTGWGVPAPLETPAVQFNLSLQLATDASGNAIAVWTSDDTVRAVRYRAGFGWEEPATIGGDDSVAHLAVRADGVAAVVWKPDRGDGLMWSWYSPATGWAPVAPILQDSLPVSTDLTGGWFSTITDIAASGNHFTIVGETVQGDARAAEVWAARTQP